ncbi:MAG: hypothetical protein CMH53_05065 [Myxococcales bacterium]|nr:hypothetical protein [Myxococcales bacterium]
MEPTDNRADTLDDAELIDRLARIERKPPMYRVFRGTLYSVYIAVALWLVLSVAIAAWSSVYGESGDAFRANKGRSSPVAPVEP